MTPFTLSGGRGTRLWPVSRTLFPKPFCDFFEKPLMALTIERLSQLGTPRIVTIQDQMALTLKMLRNFNRQEVKAYFEPFGKNTAASVALACKIMQLEGQSEEVIGIFPADHLIENEKTFVAALRLCEKRAIESNKVITLGIKPSYPATGYGYIEVSENLTDQNESAQSFIAVRFCEKPDLDKATNFIKKGNYFWNAGIFVFKVSQMISLFKEHATDVWKELDTLKADLSNLKSIYEKVPSTSIDYAIMEKLGSNFECVPCEIGWNDVGSWKEISELSKKSHAQTFMENAKSNFVYSMDKNRVVGLVDVENLIVVDSPDALLIANKESAQKVGQLVKTLDAQKIKSADEHVFEDRPWGKYEILRDDDRFKVKVIRIDAGQQISYQSHAKRGEHWIVVAGEGTVVLNEDEVRVKKGEHIFIPQGARHRMKNASSQPVEFVEVQVGSYFGEDDIVRYQDDYGRS